MRQRGNGLRITTNCSVIVSNRAKAGTVDARKQTARGRGSVHGMNAWVQVLFDFVWVSACLALVAFSLGLILGELKIVNIAQGDLMMVGAYAMYAMRGLPFVVALALTVAFGFALGLILERGILRWVYDKGFMATLLASWGVGTVLEQGVAAIFTVSQKGIDPPLAGQLAIGGFSYPSYRVAVALGIVALLGALLLLTYRTSLGLRLRASIDNVEMASVLGISPQRMFALVFATATALAVLAGALVAPTIAINPTLGLSFLAPAFFAVLIAKQGSLAGPVGGAIAVEFVFTLLQRWLNITVAESALFGLLALFIVLKPQGISWAWKTARKETS
jgi:branched-chain amino acid transport system permease protein/urea transport system permease protein